MDFVHAIRPGLSHTEFETAALELFRYQASQNPVYRRYLHLLGRTPSQIDHLSDIPFLPISFYKTQRIVSGSVTAQKIFLSSGTSGMERSRHEVADLEVYRTSLLEGFRIFYGEPDLFEILALMPSPEENPSSSLVFMVAEWMKASGGDTGGFYLNRFQELKKRLSQPVSTARKRLLIGLTYALLDFSEQNPEVQNTAIIMETGGMKGRRNEMIREELHEMLGKRFGVSLIHSEYGMTELLSQSYSAGNGIFHSPSWMQVRIRDTEDPFSPVPDGVTGGINIIDLANIHSCAFLATEDLGRRNPDGSFQVLGRIGDADLRGCSLMMV